MKMKKAETARYLSFSASEATSTSTSISMDLLLVNVSRPVTVTTQPGEEKRRSGKTTTGELDRKFVHISKKWTLQTANSQIWHPYHPHLKQYLLRQLVWPRCAMISPDSSEKPSSKAKKAKVVKTALCHQDFDFEKLAYSFVIELCICANYVHCAAVVHFPPNMKHCTGRRNSNFLPSQQTS